MDQNWRLYKEARTASEYEVNIDQPTKKIKPELSALENTHLNIWTEFFSKLIFEWGNLLEIGLVA